MPLRPRARARSACRLALDAGLGPARGVDTRPSASLRPSLGGTPGWLNRGHVIVQQRLGDLPRACICARRSRKPGVTSAAVPVRKHSRELAELFRHDRAFDRPDAALLGEIDDGAARDAVEEAVGRRAYGCTPSLTKKMLAPVHSATRPRQSSISASRIARALGAMLLDRADHVETRGLALAPAPSGRIGPAIFRHS